MSININNLYLLLYIFYFFLSVAFDLKNKAVPNIIHLIFIVLGIPLFFHINISSDPNITTQTISDLFFRFLPGLFLLYLSILSNGALGIGDGIFIIISALFIPLNCILLILISGFLSTFLISAVILIYGKLCDKDFHRMSLPFIPFMLPGLYYILMNQPVAGGIL